MKKALLLSINIGLLLSYLFTYYCHGEIKAYTNELTQELLTKYENIKKERMNHLGIGILVAIIISYIYYSNTPNQISNFEKLNIIILLLLLLPMIVYKLLPKSDYMLKHSQSDQDYKDWFNIYLCMKNKAVCGFMYGFTVSMIILRIMNVN